ncbi:MAG: PilZ domain-containing protein [Sphingomonas bacterium]|nr:PilZ domain-containing protein [Sphingomonas bacterium]
MREVGEIKRGPRVSTDLQAVLLRPGGEEIRAIITDISKDGFKLTAEAQLKIGERLDLRVPKTGDVPAQIRWALGNEAGGVFLAPLPLRALG